MFTDFPVHQRLELVHLFGSMWTLPYNNSISSLQVRWVCFNLTNAKIVYHQHHLCRVRGKFWWPQSQWNMVGNIGTLCTKGSIIIWVGKMMSIWCWSTESWFHSTLVHVFRTSFRDCLLRLLDATRRVGGHFESSEAATKQQPFAYLGHLPRGHLGLHVVGILGVLCSAHCQCWVSRLATTSGRVHRHVRPHPGTVEGPARSTRLYHRSNLCLHSCNVHIAPTLLRWHDSHTLVRRCLQVQSLQTAGYWQCSSPGTRKFYIAFCV